jgi:hypothetical protein
MDAPKIDAPEIDAPKNLIGPVSAANITFCFGIH